MPITKQVNHIFAHPSHVLLGQPLSHQELFALRLFLENNDLHNDFMDSETRGDFCRWRTLRKRILEATVLLDSSNTVNDRKDPSVFYHGCKIVESAFPMSISESFDGNYISEAFHTDPNNPQFEPIPSPFGLSLGNIGNFSSVTQDYQLVNKYVESNEILQITLDSDTKSTKFVDVSWISPYHCDEFLFLNS